MHHDKHFDIIIAGAGVSGLLIASELSKSCNILLLESKETIEANKFWVTLKSCVDINPHLKEYVDSYFEHMEFADAYQNSYKLRGEYILWNTDRLVNYFRDSIVRNKGEILLSQRFCGYRLEKDSINIFVNDITYNAKIFIDCMGYNSPLVLAKDTINLKGYYILYGARLKLRIPIEPICLSNVMLHKHPKYFEVFPTSNGEAYATMIYPTSSINDTQHLSADFDYLIKKSIYSRFFEQSSHISKLFGIVPVGVVKKKALDRVFFFGESAQSNPAATGTCLTRLLLNYRDVSNFIIEKINKNDLSEKSLSKSPIILNSFSRKLQLQVYQKILSFNSDRFSKFITHLNRIDNDLINKFIFGDLELSDITIKNYNTLLIPALRALSPI